jgi:hypothetical protein
MKQNHLIIKVDSPKSDFKGLRSPMNFKIEGVAEENIVEIRHKANGGDSEAQLQLGCHYLAKSSHKSWDKAFKWFSDSAAQGNRRAKFLFAGYLVNGDFDRKGSDELAFELYSQLIQTGGDKLFADSLNCLGNCYAGGIGIEQNYKAAKGLYEVAAQAGSEEAKENLVLLEKEKAKPAAKKPQANQDLSKLHAGALQPLSSAPSAASALLFAHVNAAEKAPVKPPVVQIPKSSMELRREGKEKSLFSRLFTNPFAKEKS